MLWTSNVCLAISILTSTFEIISFGFYFSTAFIFVWFYYNLWVILCAILLKLIWRSSDINIISNPNHNKIIIYHSLFYVSSPKNLWNVLFAVEEKFVTGTWGLDWPWVSSTKNIVGVQQPAGKGDKNKLPAGLLVSIIIEWILFYSATGVLTLKNKLFTNYLSTLLPQSYISFFIKLYFYCYSIFYIISYFWFCILLFGSTIIGQFWLFIKKLFGFCYISSYFSSSYSFYIMFESN